MGLKFTRLIFILCGWTAYLSVGAQCNPTITSIPGTCNSLSGFIITFPTCTVGTPPYDILWSPPGGACTSPTLNFYPGPGTYTNYFPSCTCAGLYQLVLLDANFNVVGGTSALSPTCSSSPTFIPIGIPTLPSCNGQCDGSRAVLWQQGSGVLTVTFTAVGQAPVTFTTNNGSATTFTGLCAGAHTISVTDQVGCTSSNLTFTMGQPTPVAASTAVAHPICNGDSNGSFSVSPTGGTPNYTVTFNPGPTVAVAAAGTATLGGLPQGVVNVTVTDSKGCTVTTSGNLVNPPTLTLTPTQTNVTCGGTCNGAASIAVSGGGSPYSYTWSPGPGTLAGVTGICAGMHTVTVTDNNGCVRTRTVNITQPASITINPTITNVVCNNSCTASGSVTASGPSPPITFTWVAAGPTTISTASTIASRCAGNYTVFASATSDPTCIVSSPFTITQPPALTITATSQSIACVNSCTGNATANPSGGNGAPYSYTWTSPAPGGTQNTQTAVNLCAGVHTLTVRDASNCAATSLTVSITQPASFTAGITTTSLSCNGVCNGVINASPSGGTPPYNYTLASSTSTVTSASPAFTGLCAGIYTITIIDAVSPCGQSFTVNLQQPNALVPSVSTTSVTCFNACNGSLGGNAAGGTPAYTFSWTTPTGTASGGALTNRCAGNYTLTVRDANNCTATMTTALNQPSDITVTIVPTNVNCFASCNGALNANVSGGVPGYTLVWSNGFNGNPNSGLCAGNYTLTVTDVNSCQKTSTAAVGTPSAIALSQSITPALCAGSCNGSATITASGGTPPFNFQFNTIPVTSNTTGVVSGLCPGNYIASVTDANSCPQSIPFAITSPALLSAAITGSLNSCTACTGAATVTASNGTPGYLFAWTNSVGATVSTASAAAAMCPGNYTVTVTDNNTCTATTTVNIQQTIIVAAVSGGTGIQCFGNCTGSAVVSPSGGQAPYTFTWTPTGQTTQTATGLCQGTYTVLVRESSPSSCTNTATISIAQPSSITINVSQTNLGCFSVCTGAMSSTVSGGTGPYTFSWSPGGQTSSSITNQCAGNYTLRVRDANNCTVSPQNFTITQPTAITATFTPVSPTSCSLSNGSICSQASGGSGAGYTYTWSPVVATGSCLNNIPAGTYSVQISDGAGCTVTLSTILNNPVGPTITTSQQSVACFGFSTGIAIINVTGVPAFSYSWTPAVTSVSTANSSTATNLGAGNYVASVTDNNGCVTNQTITINQAPSLTLNPAVTNPACSTTSNGGITISPAGATPAYSYSWTGPAFTSTSQNVSNLAPGNYTVLITDANFCNNTFTFSLSSPPAITLTAAATRSVVCGTACDGTIVANASGGTAPLSYSWIPVGAFTGSSTATILNLCPNVYTVIATDGNSCTASRTVQLSPSTLTSGIVLQNASCSNSCNASATHTVSGGAPTFTFSWSSGPVTSSSLSGLCTGNYTATVVDANGCISQNGFTVSPVSTFTLTTAVSQPACNLDCNGSISVTPVNAQGAVTYSWAPAGSGQNPVNLCADIYTLTATDNSSCQAQSIITLTNPPAVLANVSSTNPACSSTLCNGIAVSLPANTTGTVQYTWLPAGPNSATNTNLCAGNYTLNIQDAAGCTDTQTFALVNPPALNLNTSLGPATCNSSNGSITVIPSGGNPGYTFTWNPAVSTLSTATSLSAGIYIVIVQDQSACTVTTSIALSNSNGPDAPLTFTNNLCNGTCAGSASLGTISGGTAPYTFSWVAPATTANPVNSLCAGGYTAVISDANSCLTYTGVTITEPPAISVLPNVGLPTCNGVCNGSIGVNVSGGNTPYNYSWTPAAANSSVLTNICGGTYTLVVGYNSVCTSSPQVINVPVQLNVMFTSSLAPNACFGDCNGTASVAVTATPGIPSPFSFNWSNGQFGTGPLSSSITNLCNGNYSVIATSSNGCNNTFSFAITSPQQLSLTTTVVQPSCNLCNGSSTITASGGTGSSYSYSWTTGSTGSVVSNLCAGLYQVLISDGACQQTESVVINSSSGITSETFVTTDETCAGLCDGTASVTAGGGSPPITYNWISPAVNGTNAINNLCGGVYFVNMTDAQGCVRIASTSVNAAVTLTLSVFVTPPACGGPPFTGSANVVVNGGSPAYTYSWSPVASTASNITAIGPGSYTVVVTDSGPGGGCSTSSVINISNLNGPVLSFTQTNNECFGNESGAVTVSVTSPANAAPVFAWSNGGNTNSVNNLSGGVITLTVTDSNTGCITVESFTITENDELLMNLTSRNILCNGNCEGEISILAIGGKLLYTFSWAPESSSLNRIDSLCAGDYTATVTDASGCSLSRTVTIDQGAPISFSVNLGNSSCSSVHDGSISVSEAEGYSYTWTGPGTFTASTPDILNIQEGSYSLSIVDSLQCGTDTTFEIISTIVVDAIAGADTLVCSGSSVTLNGNNSQGAANYHWFLLPNVTNTVSTSASFILGSAVENYTYQLKAISPVPGCFDLDTIVVNTYPIPYLDAGPSRTIPVYSSVIIGGNPTSEGIGTLTWTPPQELDNAFSPNPRASNTVNVTYTVSMLYGEGCLVSDTVQVNLYPEIIITSGFTPNGDGKNDTWIIDYIEQFPDNSVEIYNRWGELLFSQSPYEIPFDGTYKGKNLPVGTYYYVIHLNHPGYPKPYTGPVTIFR